MDFDIKDPCICEIGYLAHKGLRVYRAVGEEIEIH